MCAMQAVASGPEGCLQAGRGAKGRRLRHKAEPAVCWQVEEESWRSVEVRPGGASTRCDPWLEEKKNDGNMIYQGRGGKGRDAPPTTNKLKSKGRKGGSVDS